jgi:hypothetical protein
MSRRPGFALLLILALVCQPGLADPPPLGRLFLTPEQRARLDLQRQRNPGFTPNAGDYQPSQTLNGEVRSSTGRRTLWINGEVDWSGDSQTPPIPVGDTINANTGERESLIGEGKIIIRQRPRQP